MAATAAARRGAAAAPARKPAHRGAQPGQRVRAGAAPRPRRSPQRRAQPAPIPGGWLVPLAVERTAGAVGGLADSSLVVRLTRGRLWIGALAVLLVGIVGLNVLALSFTASSSRVGRQADGVERANSALRARIATGLSREEVEATAVSLGLYVPAPDAIYYRDATANDARIAANRLASGELVAGTAEATVTEVPVEEAVAPPEPPVPAPTETPIAPTEAPVVAP